MFLDDIILHSVCAYARKYARGDFYDLNTSLLWNYKKILLLKWYSHFCVTVRYASFNVESTQNIFLYPPESEIVFWSWNFDCSINHLVGYKM